jgi:hypothetical protein
MPTQNDIVAAIHGQLGEALRRVFSNLKGSGDDGPFSFSPDRGLLAQLLDPNQTRPRITVGLVLNLLPDIRPDGPGSPAAESSRLELRDRLGLIPSVWASSRPFPPAPRRPRRWHDRQSG